MKTLAILNYMGYAKSPTISNHTYSFLKLKKAKDAYVLVDPFLENVHENITRIKSNNNEVGAYISIGIGENASLKKYVHFSH